MITPISLWQIDGKTIETVTYFILGAPKITADGDCTHEIKRCLLLGMKAMKPRQYTKKQRHYLLTKVL